MLIIYPHTLLNTDHNGIILKAKVVEFFKTFFKSETEKLQWT
jgi:hypothetical protein